MTAIDAVEMRAELELELEWRESEIRFMENHGSTVPDGQKGNYRKSLIMLVYAHLEGFCKAALSIYATHINSTGCQVRDVDWAIAAASLELVFSRLRDSNRKSDVFRKVLPDDSKLHRFCREQEFLERLSEFESLKVAIPVEEVVKTESNLKPVVLRKMLYRLGLDIRLVDRWEGELKKLVHIRNGIAHGSAKQPLERKKYEDLRDAASEVCNDLIIDLFSAARSNSHLRQPHPLQST